jgi:ATP-dependent helicase HrpB
MRASGLPIDTALPALRAVLSTHRACVLQAPPGAGKSTVVPLALLDEEWMRGRRMLMLEPRRLAARAVAERMASTLGEAPGDTVGYRMRLDTRVSRRTRIEVVTEGVLTRLLQEDPDLEGVALVIFDEFHERSLQADLGLALTLDARKQLATDLRVLVMSATLDGAAVAALLDDAPVVTAEVRVFPVETRYVGNGLPLLPGGANPPERLCLQIILRALREERGDVLVFLPGAGEIRRVQEALEASEEISNVRIRPLYGDLGPEQQREAIAPTGGSARRVVLATNIAETSLTIEGVRIVVDSGLARRSRFDPVSGMSGLETVRISRASADQRQGRAGRLEPGICYRLWSAGAHRTLAAFTPPEIAEADLASLALELASWGASEAAALRWLDPPPRATLGAARALLQQLGALDASGRITPHGREMTRIPAHPRLAHMLLKARELGAARLGAEIAALLSERDLFRSRASERDADVRARLAVLRREADAPVADRGAVQRIRRSAQQLERSSASGSRPAAAPAAASTTAPGTYPAAAGDALAGVLLGFAYPDRIGRRRAEGQGRYVLANGRGARFEGPQSLARAEFIVAADLDDREREALILVAAPVDRADLEAHFAERLHHRETFAWDSRQQAVVGRRIVELDGLIVDEAPLHALPQDAARAAMLEGLRSLGLAALPWSREARELQARIAFVGRLGRRDLGDWPDASDGALERDLAAWLAAWLEGVTRREHLARIPLVEALRSRLTSAQQQRLEDLAPTHLAVPSGSRVRIDYLDENAPSVAVRLQEVFGTPVTPRIGGGAVPVTFVLLSPAQRPLQITRNLESFWRDAYSEVRKDMRGRYPKHYWPEDPLQAEPMRGVRRRS